MKVRVNLEIAQRKIDEVVTGRDADDILAQAKARVERELGWKGIFLKAMTPLGFAQEVVRRYNAGTGSQYAIPQSAGEFLKLGADLGYLQEITE
jgi:hypothetical protein